RARDGREMMAEQDVARRRHIVEAVVTPDGGRGPPGVQPEHLPGQIAGVEPVGDGVDAQRRHDDPDGADAFALVQGDDGEGYGPQYGDGAENQRGPELAHGEGSSGSTGCDLSPFLDPNRARRQSTKVVGWLPSPPVGEGGRRSLTDEGCRRGGFGSRRSWSFP